MKFWLYEDNDVFNPPRQVSITGIYEMRVIVYSLDTHTWIAVDPIVLYRYKNRNDCIVEPAIRTRNFPTLSDKTVVKLRKMGISI